jgi:prevent-host-death family protein
VIVRGNRRKGPPEGADRRVCDMGPPALTANCATVCYMGETGDRPARVGVRELRQNLSVYLDRVKAGETLEVTEHGRPVARLGPNPPERMSIVDRFIAEGRITPATTDHRTLTMPPRMPGTPLSEILQEMRDEDER